MVPVVELEGKRRIKRAVRILLVALWPNGACRMKETRRSRTAIHVLCALCSVGLEEQVQRRVFVARRDRNRRTGRRGREGAGGICRIRTVLRRRGWRVHTALGWHRSRKKFGNGERRRRRRSMKSGPRICALVLGWGRGYGVGSELVVGQGAWRTGGEQDAVNGGLGLGVFLERARSARHGALLARHHGALGRAEVCTVRRPARGRACLVVLVAAAVGAAVTARPSRPLPSIVLRRRRAVDGLVLAPGRAGRRGRLCCRHVVCGEVCGREMQRRLSGGSAAHALTSGY
jgi:hypothetical protein